MRFRRAIALLRHAALGLAGATVAGSSHAQASSVAPVLVIAENSPTMQLLADPFIINLGIFVVTSTNRVGLSGTANAGGKSVDFGETFGTNGNSTRFRADALWRITPTQHVLFMWFASDVTGTRTLNRDINWGDDTFKAGLTATAEIRNNVYELSYEYAFLRGRDYEVGASFGVHYDRINASISGTATVTLPDGTVHSASAQSKAASVPAPLPVFGLRATWAVTDHIILSGGAQVFKISYDGIDGSWWNARAEAAWMFSHHFGVGLGYDYFDVHASINRTNFNGNLSWGYQGLMAFVRGGF